MKILFTSFFRAKNLALSLFFCLPMVAPAQVIFTQDFSASTTISTYVGTGANQFDYIGTGGSSSVYATGNKLTLQRNGTTAAFAKTTAFSPTPTFLKIKFKLSVPFSGTTATATAGVFYVGSGLVAANNTTGELASNGSRHSSLLVGFAATSGTFNIRNPAFVTSGNYTGVQEITWYINNNGASVNYVDPAGGSTTLANDEADIWVGTTRIFNAIPAQTPTQDLTNFKFLFSNAASNSAIAIDDLEISTVAASILPVSLTNFRAKKGGAANQLTWTTESETNNKGFYVERQTVTGAWETLSFVKGIGKAATYAFTDKDPLSISYYRLRQVDFDGAETLSKVVSVSQTQKGQMSISPNPTSDKLNIQLKQNEASNQAATLVLSDMTGRQILTQTTTASAFQLDLSNLAKGMYVMTVQSNNAIYQEKIIRQ